MDLLTIAVWIIALPTLFAIVFWILVLVASGLLSIFSAIDDASKYNK